jgi:hypothetical protein
MPKLTWIERRSAPSATASSAEPTRTFRFEVVPSEVEAETWIPRSVDGRRIGATSRTAPFVTMRRSAPFVCSSFASGANSSSPSIGPIDTE